MLKPRLSTVLQRLSAKVDLYTHALRSRDVAAIAQAKKELDAVKRELETLDPKTRKR
jgi:hypothetical protein